MSFLPSASCVGHVDSERLPERLVDEVHDLLAERVADALRVGEEHREEHVPPLPVVE